VREHISIDEIESGIVKGGDDTFAHIVECTTMRVAPTSRRKARSCNSTRN
jgi:hypothetical protein